MINRVIEQGRLTKDPELRKTNDNKSVVSFTIAVDKGYSKGAYFFDCVAWEKTAETVANYFTKGKMIMVDGKLQTREWEDKQGNKRKVVEILAQEVSFADSVKSTKDLSQEVEQKFSAVTEPDDDFPF